MKFNLEDDNTITTPLHTYRPNGEQITRGGSGVTRWRFYGANTLIREQFNPGYIRRVTVQLDGSLDCHANISFSPRSGTLYQMNQNLDGTGETLFLRAVTAKNVTCKVIGRAWV
jgi:hypothetical protein